LELGLGRVSSGFAMSPQPEVEFEEAGPEERKHSSIIIQRQLAMFHLLSHEPVVRSALNSIDSPNSPNRLRVKFMPRCAPVLVYEGIPADTVGHTNSIITRPFPIGAVAAPGHTVPFTLLSSIRSNRDLVILRPVEVRVGSGFTVIKRKDGTRSGVSGIWMGFGY
jgi:hypothetical protein